MAEKTEKKVKVKIRPLRGIGGYGEAGDIVEMPLSEAKRYVAEGYVDILGKEGDPEPVKSEKADEAAKEE